jgi:hypothetical protein
MGHILGSTSNVSNQAISEEPFQMVCNNDSVTEVRRTDHIRLANSETGPIAIPVTDVLAVKNIRNIVLGYWPRRRNDYFPGPQPVSLERRDLFKLKKFPYLVCVKSDGMRFMMLCTKRTDEPSGNKCYMIDRAFRPFEVVQSFSDIVYKNTLFDGELVKMKNGVWTYVIHDCVSFKGEDVSQLDFNKRYACVSATIETFLNTAEPSKDSFPIVMKKFVPFNEIKTLIEMESRNEISHPTDGLIFTPVMLPIGTNAQYTLFKWKSIKLHTFDFKITNEPDKYVAFVNNKGVLSAFASVSKDSAQGKDFGEKLASLTNPKYESGMIVECEYNSKTSCFDPLFVRTDKTHPNGLYTVDKTLLNIRENITIEELSTLHGPN